MKKQKYNVIGVMSGTSLDGIDLAYIHFDLENGRWNFEILTAETMAYSNEWKEKLNDAFTFSAEELQTLNEAYTKLLSDYILTFIAKNNVTEIDAVCTHGHTILHQPEKGFTLQIGNLPILANYLQYNVVCDFRVQDVQLGGQGAPLVPIGDELLFSDYDYCLNLGGFSNISCNRNGKRIAYDISPVNIVLNYFAEKLGFSYDNGGALARSGILNEELFDKLNALPFYAQPYPKSLGKEFVWNEVLPLLVSQNPAKKEAFHRNILRTFTEHTAFQIARNVEEKTKILVTGGGAYNTFLMEKFKQYRPENEWIIPNDLLIQYKEALIFGFLGVLRLRNEINVLSSVTGARNDHSSGVVFFRN